MQCAITSLGIVLWSVSLMGSAHAQSHRWDGCPQKDSYEMSLVELVEAASFIGLYDVRSAEKDALSLFDDIESYTYRLAGWTILNRQETPQPLIEIRGAPPIVDIPQSYLVTTELHARINPTRPGGFGLTDLKRLRGEEQCQAAPAFKVGYRYLIIGGVDSRIAFEPIHAPELDAWYKAVEDTVNAER